MTDVHIEDHESLIKTPQQLIVVVLLSFIVPVAAILLIVKLVMGGIRVDESSNAMSEDAIANRLKPVGEVVVVAGGEQAASSGGGAEALYNKVCHACHGAGLAGAPKTGDIAGWKTRIAQGNDILYKNAIDGKNLMPAKGGAMSASDDDIKAAVDYMISKSK